MRGNTFLHPRLGISFSVPPGFIIDNSAAAVTATGPGDLAVRFDGVALNPRTQLADYIRSGWVAGLDPNSIRTLTINGNEAATARAAADGWKFDITVIRAAGQVYRLLTAAPTASNQLDATAQTVGGSFKLLVRTRKGLAEAAEGPRRDREAGSDGRLDRRDDGRRRSQARTLPGPERACAGRHGVGGRQGQDHHRQVTAALRSNSRKWNRLSVGIATKTRPVRRPGSRIPA